MPENCWLFAKKLPCILAFTNDIIIFSKDYETHLENVKSVFVL